MEKSKNFNLLGIIALFSLIMLNSTDYFGYAAGTVAFARLFQFAGPLCLCGFIFSALESNGKYYKNILFLLISYLLWNIFYFVISNGFNLGALPESLYLALTAKYMYIPLVALQFLIILPLLNRIYKHFPIALITFALIWTLFFQQTYVSGKVIYYRIENFPHIKLLFHMWLIYPVMCLALYNGYVKIISSKWLEHLSLAGFALMEIIIYLEGSIKDWGWTFIRPSVIFLSFFTAVILITLFNRFEKYGLVRKLSDLLSGSFNQMYFVYTFFLLCVNFVLKSRGGILGMLFFAMSIIVLTFLFGVIKNLLYPKSRIHSPRSEAGQ